LNPDSILPPDTVYKLRQHSKHLEPPYMIGARLLDDYGHDQRGCRRALLTPTTAFIEALHLGSIFPSVRLNFNDQPIPSTLTAIPAISGAFMYVSANDFWNNDGFDEGYFLHVEDLDFCLRFHRKGGTIYFAPDIVVNHSGGTSKVTHAFLEKHKADGFARYFQKNFAHQYPRLFLEFLKAATYLRMYIKLSMS
jgi:N-acetylglucosaminyl-diphospho-decaprenol L-rhamnosyltransferase